MKGTKSLLQSPTVTISCGANGSGGENRAAGSNGSDWVKQARRFRSINRGRRCSNKEKEISSTPKLIYTVTLCNKVIVSKKREEISSTPKLIYTVTLCSKEEHPECNSRVPALQSFEDLRSFNFKIIKLLLFKMLQPYSLPLTRKEYCPKIYVIQFAATAMKKDSLIVTLLQAMETVSDGSGDTYATDTTFKESLVAAGADLSLVDYVEITLSIPISVCTIAQPGQQVPLRALAAHAAMASCRISLCTAWGRPVNETPGHLLELMKDRCQRKYANLHFMQYEAGRVQKNLKNKRTKWILHHQSRITQQRTPILPPCGELGTGEGNSPWNTGTVKRLKPGALSLDTLERCHRAAVEAIGLII
ncbi:hypothetical protein Tco_0456712 [Tanacetum coccineum]